MMNDPSHLIEEMGFGPLWVRRQVPPLAPSITSPEIEEAPAALNAQSIVAQVQAAARTTSSNPQPMKGDAIAENSIVLPESMDSPPSWLDEMDAAVVISPVYIPENEEDEVTAARVDVAKLDWPQLDATVAACQQCGLCRTRQQTVFGVGDQKAKWFIVGEGPGRQEDEQGQPFVGPAGQLLDSMLAALGLRRGENVYIANVLKCRPTDEAGKDRRPSKDEVTACLPYLQRQIALAEPDVIVALGHTAAWALLNIDPATPVGKLRGAVHQYQGRPVIVTYHPSYLLRQPQEKAQSWKDLCLAVNTFQETAH
jgi:uracil-DNA glycosylase family 4